MQLNRALRLAQDYKDSVLVLVSMELGVQSHVN